MIAVSGGADSLALLHILWQIQHDLEIILHAATLNHGIRPTASLDVDYVTQVSQRLSIPITVHTVDVPRLAETHHIGIELAARNARYEFLADVAHNIGAQNVTVAHHADDQAETVLMRLLRGTGGHGLRGMSVLSSVPGSPDLNLIRPLLNFTHAQLVAYCKENQLSPQYDETNSDLKLLRNQIRLEVMPYLKRINPKVETALLRLSNVSTLEQEYIESEYLRLVKPYIKYEDQMIFYERERFRQLSRLFQYQWVYQSAVELMPNGTGYDQIDHAVLIGLQGKVGSIAELGDNLQLRVNYTELVIGCFLNSNLPEDELLLEEDLIIPVIGSEETHIPNGKWSFCLLKEDLLGNATLRFALPENAKVILRTRRPGDIFSPLGMQGKTQKIKKWMIDHKIPQKIRNYVPLLVVNDVVAAIIFKDRSYVSHHFSVMIESQLIGYFFVNYS